MGKLPERVTIELTNRCNRQCVMCPRLKMTYPLGDMSLELLKSIADQLPEETPIVTFFRGESVGHKDFVKAMKILQKFDNVSIATNGDGLTENKKVIILDTCSFVSYSIHDFGYPSDHFGIAEFLGLAKNIGIDTQISIINTMIPSEENKKRFIREWLPYVDRVRVYIEHSHDGFGDIKDKPNIPVQSCHKPFSDMVIYWDGKVVLCNHDWDNYEPVGDLNYQTIKEVWNNEKYQVIRGLHIAGKLRYVPSCQYCDQWIADYVPDKLLGEVYTEVSK